ncbi:response regulator receiver protein [Emticicia oligotrophica DSM 17448]|uniref:Response regulator receiver protein n=1 Tax=Emticicia oligotrophica (strain DSM 17448 / CIP 109782 / MTCC 6937 / GPTSA100-15) TaxID=929562 RepID=A0ABM5MWE6_EMTOG|nr:LytTR family DNA-binding domain-containing protein [Emticicia oligotrophica]AFK01533.1 response regulator receiver protein [Emticicia oligotrophica DSM 17448]
MGLLFEEKVSTSDKILKLLRDFSAEIRVEKVDSFSENSRWLVPIQVQKNNISAYKNRFLVKIGNNILFKNIDEIAYFFAEDKIVYLVSVDAKQYIVDYRLEQLETLLNPYVFYRINRKFFVKIDAIQKVKQLTNNRLQLFLKPNFEQEIFISKDKVKEFKAWLDQ